MPISPPTVAPLPAPPDPNDRASFNVRAYPWSVAQQAMATDLTALAANVFANATEAVAAASTATAQANAAVAAVGAAVWVSGTNYAVGVGVYSPSTLATYRCAVAGVSTADPAADPARWVRLGAAGVPDFVLQTLGVI